MPFAKRDDLPTNVKNVLPAHAQDIYKEAFNSAYEEYKDPDDRKQGGTREEAAHRVAWAAVKKKYHKGDGDKWHSND
jgi:cation transport regulator